MYCESRQHHGCLRDEEVEYYPEFDMELCPLCYEFECELVALETAD